MKSNKKNSVLLYGGLGNQLFQIAAGIYASEKTFLEVVGKVGAPRLNLNGLPDALSFDLPQNLVYTQIDNMGPNEKKFYLYLLKVSSHGFRDLKGKIVGRTFRPIYTFFTFRRFPQQKLFLSNGVGFDDDLNGDLSNTLLIGCFHSYRWVANDFVKRKMRSLKIGSEKPWLTDLFTFSKDEKPIVVHIRRGDYQVIPELGYIGIDYFLTAINQMKLIYPHSRIWIFSDDFDFVKHNLPIALIEDARLIDYDQANAALNLQAMRYGHSYIISNSTFSWWGAFLSHNENATVMRPKFWFKSKPNPRDIFPEEWIAV